MKKTFALILTIVFILALSSCGDSENNILDNMSNLDVSVEDDSSYTQPPKAPTLNSGAKSATDAASSLIKKQTLEELQETVFEYNKEVWQFSQLTEEELNKVYNKAVADFDAAKLFANMSDVTYHGISVRGSGWEEEYTQKATEYLYETYKIPADAIQEVITSRALLTIDRNRDNHIIINVKLGGKWFVLFRTFP